MGLGGWEILENPIKKRNNKYKASSILVRVSGYRTNFRGILQISQG